MAGSAGVHVIVAADHATAVLHPLRRRILGALDPPESASGLARRFGLSRQHVNYHLRLLESAGLVELVGERKRRGCTERLVRAVADSFVIAPGVLGEIGPDPDRVGETEANTLLVAAAARMIDEVADLRGRVDPAGKPLNGTAVQTEVRLTTPGLQRMFMEELSEAVSRVAAKYHDGGSVGGRRIRVLVGAYPASEGGAGGSPASRRRWLSARRTARP